MVKVRYVSEKMFFEIWDQKLGYEFHECYMRLYFV